MARSKQKHLLVIRLSAMGDVAMSVPVLLALMQKYPELKITVLTKSFYSPILEQIPNVNVHIANVTGEHKGILGLWKLYKELSHIKIDAVADLHNVLRSSILKQFFRIRGARVIQIDKGRKEKKALTARTNKVFKPLKTTHQRYADVFEQLGYPLTLGKNFLPKHTLTREIREKLEIGNSKYIGIAPFAAFAGKTYSLALMELVLAELNTFENYRIFLFGGGEREKQQLEAWEKKFSNCIAVVGKITFLDELKLISNLVLMLSMDSGNGHLAAMFGVPTITLWGVTHPFAGFCPYHQEENTILSDREKFAMIPTSVYGNKFPSGYERAMETIAPNEVLNKIRQILHEKD